MCVRKAELAKRGYASFEEWASVPGHVYIGRSMEHYVPGTAQSVWANPFNVKRHGRDECIRLYEEQLRASPELMRRLGELAAASELGCWCAPEPCHGDVLVKLLAEAEANK